MLRHISFVWAQQHWVAGTTGGHCGSSCTARTHTGTLSWR